MATAPISLNADTLRVSGSNAMADTPERLVKSSERVRGLGEVFTPKETVAAVLDMLPAVVWSVYPQYTFLEPACGDGNFLDAVLARKLDEVRLVFGGGQLPGGVTPESVQFHGLCALASIYAVDISSDNVIGGTPGHEIGARTRLLNRFSTWHKETLGRSLSNRSPALKAATWIVEHNVLVGNMLARDGLDRPTGRDQLPLIEYIFEPADLSVELRCTTLGEVLSEESAASSGELSLFPPSPPAAFWRGAVLRLASADRIPAPRLQGPAWNGRTGVPDGI